MASGALINERRLNIGGTIDELVQPEELLGLRHVEVVPGHVSTRCVDVAVGGASELLGGERGGAGRDVDVLHVGALRSRRSVPRGKAYELLSAVPGCLDPVGVTGAGVGAVAIRESVIRRSINFGVGVVDKGRRGVRVPYIISGSFFFPGVSLRIIKSMAKRRSRILGFAHSSMHLATDYGNRARA